MRSISPSAVVSPRIINAAAAGLLAVITALGLLWSTIHLSPSWIVVLIGGAALFTLAVASGRFERFMLGLLFLLIPINPDVNLHPIPDPPIGVQLLGVSVIDLILVALYGAWIIRLVTRADDARIEWPAGLGALVAFLGWGALSIINAREPALSVYMLVAILKCILWFFYLANHVKTRRDVELVMACLLIGLILESFFAFAQHAAGSPLGLSAFGERTQAKEVELDASRVFRVGGTLGHPNALGGYLAAVLPVAMALSLADIGRRFRALSVAAAACGSVALILTYCRSAWLAVALMVMVLIGWLLADRTRRRRLVPVFVVMTALCGVLGMFAPTIKARWTEDDQGSTISRLSQFRIAGLMISQHPILGVGLNHYTVVNHLYETYVDADKRGMVFIYPGRVHSIFLLTAAEMGVMSLLVLGWFLWVTCRRGLRKVAASRDELIRFACMGMMLGLAARIMHDGFHTGNITTITILWIFPALLVTREPTREAAHV